MKKIDLHLHTVPSLSDSHFDFSLEKLKEYVIAAEIDCIAITNHNLFDKEQFEFIASSLQITVLPGIEIDLDILAKRVHVVCVFDDTVADHSNKIFNAL